MCELLELVGSDGALGGRANELEDAQLGEAATYDPDVQPYWWEL